MKISFSMLWKPKTKTEYKCHLRKRINNSSKKLDQSVTINRIHVRSPTFAVNNISISISISIIYFPYNFRQSVGKGI